MKRNYYLPLFFLTQSLFLILVLSCQKEKLPEPTASNKLSGADSLKNLQLFVDTTKQIIDFITNDSLTTKASSITVDYLKTFSSNAGDNDYFILKSNSTWKISSYPSWVTVSPLSGTGNTNVTVTVKENTGAQRSGQIVITGRTAKQTASITALQLGKTEGTINGSVAVDYLKTFSSLAGDNDYFVITANTSWKIINAPSWVTISSLSGTGNANITVTVQANTGAQRSGVITVSGVGVSQNVSLNVIQEAGNVTSTNFIPNDVINYYPFTNLGSTIINKRLSIDASVGIAPLHFQNTNVDIENCKIESQFTSYHDLLTIEGATSPQNVKFNYNSVTFKNANPHTIVVGTEGPTSSDNMYDGAELIGNELTGIGDFSSSQNHTLFVGHNKNSAIKYNKLINCPDAIVVKSVQADNSGGVISYNLIKNSGFGVVISGNKNTKVYNNTFYSENSGFPSYTSFIEIEIGTGKGSGASGTDIKNNIFVSNGLRWLMISIEDYASLAGLKCDYNVYYRNGGTISFAYVDANGITQYASFAQWQAMGFDTHSVVIDPGLDPNSLIPANPVYHAINLGTSYNSGLSTSNIWDRNQTITTQQSTNWQNGAYIK